MIIGLAGRSCSGKNVVSAMLMEKGFDSIDMDLMVHEQLNDIKDRLTADFGNSILKSNGEVDRKVLGRIVFPSPEKLKRLEDLLYPELHKSLNLILTQRESSKPLVINAAALQKGDFWEHCDSILWIDSPLLLRVFRGWKRDRRPIKDILRRFAAQKELKSQYFLSRVDTYIIRNGLFRSVLNRRVDKWVKYLLSER